MGKHAFRGAVTAWLALIALQAITAKGGSGKVSSFFGDVDNLVTRALSPDVPAIPDRRGTASVGGATYSYITPAQAQEAAKAAAGSGALSVFGSNGALNNLPSLGEYANNPNSLAGLGSQFPTH